MQKVLENLLTTLKEKLMDAKSMLGLGSDAQKAARAAEIKEIENSLQNIVDMLKKKKEGSEVQLGDLKNALEHVESLHLRDDLSKLNDELFEGFDLYPANDDDLRQVVVDMANEGYAPNDPKFMDFYDDSRLAAHIAVKRAGPASEYNQWKEDVALKFVEDDYLQKGGNKTYEDIKNTVLDEDGYPVDPADIKSNVVSIKTGENLPDKTAGINPLESFSEMQKRKGLGPHAPDAKETVTPAYIFGKPSDEALQADIDFFKGMDEISEKSAQPIGDPLKAEYIDSGAADTMSFEEFVAKKNKDELATGGRVGFNSGNIVDRHPGTSKSDILMDKDALKQDYYARLGLTDRTNNKLLMPGDKVSRGSIGDLYGTNMDALAAARLANNVVPMSTYNNTRYWDDMAAKKAEMQKDKVFMNTQKESQRLLEEAKSKSEGLYGAQVAQADMSFVDMINQTLNEANQQGTEMVPVPRPRSEQKSLLETESEEERYSRLGHDRYVSSRDTSELVSELKDKNLYERYAPDIEAYIINGHGSNTLFDALLGL